MLAIISNSAKLFDLDEEQVAYSIPQVTSSRIQLHSSGKYVALDAPTGSLLIETLNGRVVATQPGTGPVGFGHDGSDILRLTNDSIERWDLLSTTEVIAMPKRNLSFSGGPRMLDDRYAWVGGTIYDTKKKTAMWRYDISSTTAYQIVDDRFVAAMVSGRDDQRQVIVGIAKVPHANAVAMMDPYTVDDMLAVKPGTPVRLQTSNDDKVTRRVTAAFVQNGWVLDGGARIVVSGSAERGPSETHIYDKSRFRFSPLSRNRKPGPDAETVSIAPWKQTVEIRLGETVLWSRNSGHIPSSLQLRQGETAQQKLQELTKPTWGVFENLKIPAEIFHPTYRYGVGRTSLTSGGFVDQVYNTKR